MATAALPLTVASLLYSPAGQSAVALRGLSGGGLIGTVNQSSGANKIMVAVRPEPLTVACELPLDKPFQDMLAFGSPPAQIKDTVTAVGAAGEALYHLDLTKPTLSSVRVPRCDAAAPSLGRLLLTLQPLRSSGYRRKVGEIAPKPPKPSPLPPWMTNQFRLDIKGLDCSRVSSIEEIVVRRPVIFVDEGTDLDTGPQEPGNLTVRLPLSHCAGWLEWQDSRLTQAGNDERSATLSLLAGDMTTVLGKVTLGGLGLFALKLDPVGETNPVPACLTASMYVESVTFDLLRK